MAVIMFSGLPIEKTIPVVSEKFEKGLAIIPVRCLCQFEFQFKGPVPDLWTVVHETYSTPVELGYGFIHGVTIDFTWCAGGFGSSLDSESAHLDGHNCLSIGGYLIRPLIRVRSSYFTTCNNFNVLQVATDPFSYLLSVAPCKSLKTGLTKKLLCERGLPDHGAVSHLNDAVLIRLAIFPAPDKPHVTRLINGVLRRLPGHLARLTDRCYQFIFTVCRASDIFQDLNNP